LDDKTLRLAFDAFSTDVTVVAAEVTARSYAVARDLRIDWCPATMVLVWTVL
jgi:hypothetical protein